MNKISMMFPDFKLKAYTTSFDDGFYSDIQLVNLMKKYSLKGTFNLCSEMLIHEGEEHSKVYSYPPLTIEEALEIFADGDSFEVASHGRAHEASSHTPSANGLYDQLADRRRLEEIFGRLVPGHVYPYGKYTKDSVQCAKMCGFTYARIGWDHDTSFSVPRSDEWMVWRPTAHFLEDDFDRHVQRFLKARVHPGDSCKLFLASAHSFEFLPPGRWERLEEQFKVIAGHDSIWYATCGQIHDYVEAYRSLIFFADATKVYNPTHIDVYIHCEYAGSFCIPGGATVSFDKN